MQAAQCHPRFHRREILNHGLLQSLLPSSLASILFHGIIIAATVLAARGCEKGVPVDAGGNEYRTIGLTQLPDDATEQTDSELPPAAVVDPAQDGEVEAVPDVNVAVPESVPSVNKLLEHVDSPSPNTSIELPDVVGVGAPLPGMDLPSRLVPPTGGRLSGAFQRHRGLMKQHSWTSLTAGNDLSI